MLRMYVFIYIYVCIIYRYTYAFILVFAGIFAHVGRGVSPDVASPPLSELAGVAVCEAPEAGGG